MTWKIQINRIIGLAVVFLTLLATPTRADDIVGQASVIDGDTIEIHGTRIRLWGIDAPESAQLCRDDDSNLYHCGRVAATALAGILWAIKRPITWRAPKAMQVIARSRGDKAGLLDEWFALASDGTPTR